MLIDCFIGIDPGKQGGISVWKPNEQLKVYKMPDDLSDLRPFFRHILETNEHPLVCLEKVQMHNSDMSIPGKAIVMQKLFAGFQKLKDVMEFENMPFVQVHPISWQSFLKIRKKKEDKKDRKNRYKAIAQDLYPEVKATLWNCDATLILHFLRKKNMMDENWIYENLPTSLHKLFD